MPQFCITNLALRLMGHFLGTDRSAEGATHHHLPNVDGSIMHLRSDSRKRIGKGEYDGASVLLLGELMVDLGVKGDNKQTKSKNVRRYLSFFSTKKC